jgi:phosphoesterase RecJ-like protein
MVLDDIKVFITERDNFLVSTHVNPDGDAIGSVLVFGQILDELEKNYRIVLQDPPQEKFSFLSNFNKIQLYSPEVLGDFKVENMIALDCASMGRLGEVQKLMPSHVPTLNIDHHPDNDLFGTINLVDKNASSNCELIYEVIKKLGIGFDSNIASQIYTSIMFDTGRFHFSNTTGQAMRVCAEMLEKGADPYLIANAVYHEKPKASIVILRKMLNSLELHLGDRVGFMHLKHEDLAQGGEETSDMDGFVDFPLTIKGVEVSIFAREQEPGKFKASLRAKNDVKVNEIAHAFNGGGHTKAAGLRIEGDLKEVKEKLLKETVKYL